MDAPDTLIELLLGGLLGAVGQGIRALAGLKKLSASKEAGDTSNFDPARLLVSLLLGFIAGTLGMVGIFYSGSYEPNNVQKVILPLIGIGYSGTDFIESFLTKYVSQALPNGQGPAAGPGQPGVQNVTSRIWKARLPYSTK